MGGGKCHTPSPQWVGGLRNGKYENVTRPPRRPKIVDPERGYATRDGRKPVPKGRAHLFAITKIVLK